MAQNTVMQQWAEMNQAAMQTYQQMLQKNIEAMQSFMPAQQMGHNFSDWLQNSMIASNEFKRISEETFSTVLQNQTSLMSIGVPTTAVKELGEIFANTMQQLSQQELSLTSTYMDSVTEYMDELKKAKTAEDVVGAQTVMLNNLQNKVKESTMESLQLVSSLKAGMTAWAESTVDSMQAK